MRKKSTEAQCIEPEEYKQAKKNLRYAINKSKQRCWEAVISDVNKDPWGMGYKIVCKKLGQFKTNTLMEEAEM